MGSKRIPASRQTGERIEELLAGGGNDIHSDLIRLGVRKLVEEVLEAEVEDRLGRAYYGRGDGERPPSTGGWNLDSCRHSPTGIASSTTGLPASSFMLGIPP